MKIGITVACAICGRMKAPRGRSAPVGLSLCSWDCEGYAQDPQVGDLWPGETEEDFGFPVRSAGTRDIDEQKALRELYYIVTRADRVACGLPEVPDPVRGDLDEVHRLREDLAAATNMIELARKHKMTPEGGEIDL